MRFTPKRLGSLILSVSCVLMTCVLPVAAQEKSEIQYEVVARLPIPHASQAAWSPDGSRLAIAAYPTVQIWDTQTWKLLQTIPDAPAISTKWNPAGELLAGVQGGDGETILVWDAQTGKTLKKMTRPVSPNARAEVIPIPYARRGVIIVHTLSWHPGGKKIATDSGQLDKDMLLIWDLERNNGDPQPLAAVHPGISQDDWMNISQLEWSHDGRLLLSSGYDGNFRSRSIIRLWNATTGEAVRTIFPGLNPVWGSNDQQFAGLSMRDDEYVINIWDVKTGKVVSTFKAHNDGTSVMSWNFDANVIAGADIKDHLVIWDVKTGRRHDIEGVPTPFVRSIEWRRHSNQLAIADLDEGVLILKFKFGGQN